MADFCGTGLGNFPKPGDPDLNSSLLTARAARGGIMLSWSLPGVNPSSVAYTAIFRSTSNSFGTSVLRNNAAGFYYFDQSSEETVGTTYYYWIRMTSINGTVGDVIGPVSVVMQPPVEEMISLLTGSITESALSNDLKNEISEITTVASALDDETQERLLGEATFSQLLQGLQTELDDVSTLVVNEITTRTNADSALVAQINAILAVSGDNAAAIQEEAAVRASADSALALQVTTLQATSAGNTASLQTLQQVVTGPNGLTSQYMVKTDVNGHVAGFGLYNDGATSEFIVRADTFAVGSAGHSDAYPFIIGQVNGVTKIVLNAQTLIPDAAITNAQIGSFIGSDDYQFGSSGWGIFKDFFGFGGYAEFNNIRARGDIEASSIKANVITAENIRGGAVSDVDTQTASGITINANSTVAAFTFTPSIPTGLTAKILFNNNFAGQASGIDTNCGVRVYQTNPGGSPFVVHSAGMSVALGFTESGASSFVAKNVVPGTVFTFHMENSWYQGTLINGQLTANLFMTFL